MNAHSSEPKGALLERGSQEYSIAKRKESYARSFIVPANCHPVNA